jgi:hypothetical protein
MSVYQKKSNEFGFFSGCLFIKNNNQVKSLKVFAGGLGGAF